MFKKADIKGTDIFLASILLLAMVIGAFFVEGYSLYQVDGKFIPFTAPEYYLFLFVCLGLLSLFIFYANRLKPIIASPSLIIAGAILIFANAIAVLLFPNDYLVTKHELPGIPFSFEITFDERLRYIFTFVYIVYLVYVIIDIVPQVLASQKINSIAQWIIVGFGFVSIIFSLVTEWHEYQILDSVNITSFTVNRNAFGFFIVLAMSAMIVFHERCPRFWNWAIIVFFYIFLYFPISKTAVVVGSFILGAYALYRFFRTMKRHAPRNIMTASIVVAIILSLVILGATGNLEWWDFYVNIRENFEGVFDEHNTMASRMEIWQYCLSLLETPLQWVFGLGDGNAGLILGFHLDGERNIVGIVHNGLLCALFYGGIIRLFYEALLWIFLGWRCVKMIIQGRSQGFCFLIILIGFFARGMAENTYLIAADGNNAVIHILLVIPILCETETRGESRYPSMLTFYTKEEENPDYALPKEGAAFRRKKMEGKVVATDLDGTFFYPKRRVRLIPRSNREFTRRFIDDGGRLLLVSSRNAAALYDVQKSIDRPIDMVGCNGAFVMVDGHLVYEKSFDNKRFKEILDDVLSSFNLRFYMISTRDYNVLMERTPTTWLYGVYYFKEGALGDPFTRSNHIVRREIEKGVIYKVMILVGISKKNIDKCAALIPELQKKYPDAQFAWSNQMIEITPKGCTKDQGIAFYLDYLGISHDNTMVVGDSGNDISMFQAFPEHSYCMSHSREDIKNHASAVVERVSDLEGVLYSSGDSPAKKKERN